jgi:hypothetical protein
VYQVDDVLLIQAISSQLRVGKNPSHHAIQLSKASVKTHFQHARSASLPYKLVFTGSAKNVISSLKKVLLAFKNHSPGPASGDLFQGRRVLRPDFLLANL